MVVHLYLLHCIINHLFTIVSSVLKDIDSTDLHNDLSVFARIMGSMERCSPDASIFILIHKMDLVPEEDRKREFNECLELVRSQSEQ